MFSLKSKTLMTVAAAGLLSAGSHVSTAQAQEGYPPAQSQQQSQADVSENKLEEFADARDAVGEAQEEFQSQAQNISSEKEMQNLQQEANEKMIQAIQETDLSVEEYNRIANLIQTSPEIRQKYQKVAQ